MYREVTNDFNVSIKSVLKFIKTLTMRADSIKDTHSDHVVRAVMNNLYAYV